VWAVIYYAFHKRSSGGSVGLLGILWDLPVYANDPYLGIIWVFPEDSPLFPEHDLQTSFYIYDTKIETLRKQKNSIMEF
jgi:hypothetical protein